MNWAEAAGIAAQAPVIVTTAAVCASVPVLLLVAGGLGNRPMVYWVPKVPTLVGSLTLMLEPSVFDDASVLF